MEAVVGGPDGGAGCIGLKDGGGTVGIVPHVFTAEGACDENAPTGCSTGDLVYVRGVRIAIDLYPEVGSERETSCGTLCCICIDSAEVAKLRPYGAECGRVICSGEAVGDRLCTLGESLRVVVCESHWVVA